MGIPDRRDWDRPCKACGVDIGDHVPKADGSLTCPKPTRVAERAGVNMLRGKTVHELITNALDLHLSNMGMNVGDGDAETLADKVVSALELAGFVVSRSR